MPTSATPVVISDSIIAKDELGRPVGAWPVYLVDQTGAAQGLDAWAAARGVSGVTQALRSWIKAASIDNPIINTPLVSGGGCVTVTQTATETDITTTAGLTSIGNLATMSNNGTLPVSLLGGRASIPFGTAIRISQPTTGTGGFNPFGWESTIDGAAIAFQITANASFRLIVDNCYVADSGAPTVPKLFTTTTNVYVLIQFAAASRHVVRIEMVANNYIEKVYKAASATISKGPARPNILIVTDSYVNTTVSWDYDSFGKQLGNRLNANVTINGVPGSGVNNPGTGTQFGSTNRLGFLEVAGFVYDAVIPAGSINDTGATYGATAAGGYANYLAYLQNIRARHANLILPVGVWAGATGPSVGANSVMDQEAAIEAAVATFNDPLCRYIPVSKPNGKYGPIIFGTGKVGSTNGSGNSDTLTKSDGVHPPQAGHTEIAKQLAIRIQDALNV